MRAYDLKMEPAVYIGLGKKNIRLHILQNAAVSPELLGECIFDYLGFKDFAEVLIDLQDLASVITRARSYTNDPCCLMHSSI